MDDVRAKKNSSGPHDGATEGQGSADAAEGEPEDGVADTGQRACIPTLHT